MEVFVTHLGASSQGLATGGELFRAYEAMRAECGWPATTQATFGRRIRTAIEGRGGRKIKSRGQQVYSGESYVIFGVDWLLPNL
jgi:hypothetical protein